MPDSGWLWCSAGAGFLVLQAIDQASSNLFAHRGSSPPFINRVIYPSLILDQTNILWWSDTVASNGGSLAQYHSLCVFVCSVLFYVSWTWWIHMYFGCIFGIGDCTYNMYNCIHYVLIVILQNATFYILNWLLKMLMKCPFILLSAWQKLWYWDPLCMN